MIFSKARQNREGKKSQLQEQIELMGAKRRYTLTRFEVHNESFGNVIVELKNREYTLRFIQDRGDIYFDKKLNGCAVWIEQELMFPHAETSGDSYDTLIKAIGKKIN